MPNQASCSGCFTQRWLRISNTEGLRESPHTGQVRFFLYTERRTFGFAKR